MLTPHVELGKDCHQEHLVTEALIREALGLAA